MRLEIVPSAGTWLPTTIPFATSVFPDELHQAPRSWAERAYPDNLIYFNERLTEAATSPSANSHNSSQKRCARGFGPLRKQPR